MMINQMKTWILFLITQQRFLCKKITSTWVSSGFGAKKGSRFKATSQSYPIAHNYTVISWVLFYIKMLPYSLLAQILFLPRKVLTLNNILFLNYNKQISLLGSRFSSVASSILTLLPAQVNSIQRPEDISIYKYKTTYQSQKTAGNSAWMVGKCFVNLKCS